MHPGVGAICLSWVEGRSIQKGGLSTCHGWDDIGLSREAVRLSVTSGRRSVRPGRGSVCLSRVGGDRFVKGWGGICLSVCHEWE